MRIFLISNMYPSQKSPFYGIFVKTFAQNIQNQGASITSSALIKGSSTSFISKVYKYIKFFLSVYSGLLRSNYDIIYVHYAEHSLLPLLPIYFLLKKKLVVNAHGDDIRYDSLISNLVKPIVKKADVLVVPSKYFLDFAKSRNLNENILISPSGGIDTNKFKPIEEEDGKEEFVIGYVSRIDEDKGWDTLVYACKELQDKIPNLKVIIIGKGEEEKGLFALIDEVDKNNSIEFLGTIPNNQLIRYYNKFDLFIFPTRRLSESLGVVALEALSCGTPIIGSKIGPVEEYVIHGHNGFLFEPKDAKDLAKKIKKYYSLGKEKQTEFKENAYAVSQKYDSVTVAKQLKDYLQKLIKG